MNILTGLAADIYLAADTVGRELTGFIPAATQNAETTRVAIGDDVTSHFTRQATAVNVTPSMTIPEGTDQNVDNKKMQITKARAVQIPWRGEEQRSVNNGVGYSSIYGDQIAQAMRTITNEIEADAYAELQKSASLGFGAANANLFATDFDAVIDGRQLLVNNGCPTDDISLVLGGSVTGLRKLTGLNEADKAGTTAFRENGTLLNIHQVQMRESSQVSAQTITGAGTHRINDTDSSNTIVGSTSLEVDGTTTAPTAGEVFTLENQTQKYVVGSSSTTTLVNLNAGLLQATADNALLTYETGNYFHNFMFHRRAFEIAVRPPALPEEGDAAIDSLLVQDPFSGLVFEIRVYGGYRKAMIEVAAAWGVKGWKPEFIVSGLSNL